MFTDIASSKLACSRLSVFGEERKQKGEREKRGRTKARKGRERSCQNIFNDPLPPTVSLMRCPKLTKTKNVNLSISWKCYPIACMFFIAFTSLTVLSPFLALVFPPFVLFLPLALVFSLGTGTFREVVGDRSLCSSTNGD